MHAAESTVTLRDNTITDNVGSSDAAVSGMGGGVAVLGTSRLISITGNTIAENVAYSVTLGVGEPAMFGSGGGIWLEDFDRAEVTDNSINRNAATRVVGLSGQLNAGGGGVGMTRGKTALLADNEIELNTGMAYGARSSGGGLFVYLVQDLTVRENRFAENLAAETAATAEGGGIWYGADEVSGYVATLRDNEIISNTAVMTAVALGGQPAPFAAGGGVRAWGGNPEDGNRLVLSGNLIAGNLVADNVVDMSGNRFAGGGLAAEQFATVQLNGDAYEDNVIANRARINTAPDWGGGLEGGGAYIFMCQQADVDQVVAVRNLGAAELNVNGLSSQIGGGGISVENCRSATVRNSTLAENVVVQTLRVQGNGEEFVGCSGGGLKISNYDHEDSHAVVAVTDLTGNVCVKAGLLNGTDMQLGVEGGGLALSEVKSVQLSELKVEENLAAGDLDVMGNGNRVQTGRAAGGGIRANNATLLTMEDLTVRNNVVVQVHTLSAAESNAGGGGIALDNVVTTVMTDSLLAGNTVVMSATVRGDVGENYGATGGGLEANCWGAENCRLRVSATEFVSNTALSALRGAGTELRVGGDGGGLSANNVFSTTVSGSVFRLNVALVHAETNGYLDVGASGGGLHAQAAPEIVAAIRLFDNTFDGNIAAAAVDLTGGNGTAHEEGGGLILRNMDHADVISNSVTTNIAVVNLKQTGNGSDDWGGRPAGGGMYLGDSDQVTIERNIVRNNVTAQTMTINQHNSGAEGGGVGLVNVAAATVGQNTIADNTALFSGSMYGNSGQGLYPQGGGIMLGCWDLDRCDLLLTDNQLTGNIAAGTVTTAGENAQGGGEGGGLSANGATVVMRDNLFADNEAVANGEEGRGGVAWLNESILLSERNLFRNNRSSDGERQPVVWLRLGVLTSVNDVFIGNANGALGIEGQQDEPTPTAVSVMNDTLVDNGPVGVYVERNSVVTVTNTIVADHNRGLFLDDDNASLYSDYNLLDNTANYVGGVVQGGHDLIGVDPLFVDVTTGDVHLAADSPAIDAGTNSGAPDHDFELDTRPQDGDNDGVTEVDIGADERQGTYRSYLPSVMREN